MNVIILLAQKIIIELEKENINPNLPFNVDDTMREEELVVDDVGQVYNPTDCKPCDD